MSVCPSHDDQNFHISWDHRSKRCTSYTQFREKQHSVNKHKVEKQIYNYCSNTCFHRQHSLSTLPQCTGIYLYHHKGRKSPHNNVQIFPSITQRICHLCYSAFSFQIHVNQRISLCQEQHNRCCGDNDHHPQLIPHRVAYALLISFSKILCCENPGSGYTTENTQIVYKNQLIHNRSAGHRFCTDSSDHNIIQQTYKICDAILDHNWNCNRKNHQIKLFISDELSKKTFLFCPLHWSNLPICNMNSQNRSFFKNINFSNRTATDIKPMAILLVA